MARYILQHRRGSTAQWAQLDPIIKDGEMVIEIRNDGSRKVKIGDGRRKFSELPYSTSALENLVNVTNKRIDQLVALPEGSTQGDAELADIHIGYDGTEYDSAGEAVREQIASVKGDITGVREDVAGVREDVDYLRNNLKDFIDAYAVDGLYYENNFLYLTSGGEIVSDPVEIVGGGDGGGTSYSMRLINGMLSTTLSVAISDETMISAMFYENYGNEPTGVNGSLLVEYKLQSETSWTTFKRLTIPQGVLFSVDVASILSETEVTNVKFTVTGGESSINRSLIYNITSVEASISDVNFDSFAVYTGNINFQYKCIGRDLQKKVYFEIDGDICDEIDIGTSHNSILSHTIKMVGNYSYGVHDLRVYFETSDGAVSNILKYAILYNDGTSTQPMVGVVCNRDKITYGDVLSVNYTVYTPGQETTDELNIRVYDVDGKIYDNTARVDVPNNTSYTWDITSYPISGVAYIEFTSGSTCKVITVDIEEMKTKYNLHPVTTSLVYDYSANGRSNSDIGKELYEYEYTTVNGVSTVIEGELEDFNWVSNGYIDGESLTLSGDARHTIKLPMFSTSYIDRDGQTINLEDTEDATVTTKGRTFEIEFKVSNVTDIEDHIIKCMSADHAGFVVTPQNCYLLSSNGSDVKLDDTGFIENEESIAAAYIRDNKRIRLSFVIEPRGTIKYELEDGTKGSGQCVNIYINGQYANSHVYPDNARFLSDQYITMGSNSCILNVYGIKVYNRGLSESEILQNYNAAPLSGQEKLDRFEDNDVLNDDGDIDYEKAICKYPCLLITGPLSPYKGANGVKMEGKVESGVTLTKPDGNGGYTVEWDLLDKDLNGNWVSCNNVQGTSSQKFPLKNYKIYLVKVLYNEDGTPQTEEKDGVTQVKTKKIKYSLKGKDASGNDLSIGESTLCFKADYMSSDHANTFNANLADTLFDDITESQKIEPRVQNTIWGFRCLLFRRDDIGKPIEFVSDGALNNDKGNTKTFGLERSGDSGNNTTCQKWEFLNNTEALTSFQTDRLFKEVIVKDELVLNATQALESTYPDQGDLKEEGLTPKYDYIQTLFTWVYQRANFWDASTEIVETPYVYRDVEYYTEREYRKAIFVNEFDKHFNRNHALIYYLFMEFVALCDNRAKNMFLRCENVHVEHLLDVDGNEISIHDVIESVTGVVDADRIDWENSTFAIWITDLYDLDSGYGVENSGYIRVPYYADWDYTLDDTPQFNGNGSRLWLMVEEALASDIMTKAQILTERGVGTGGLNYDTLYDTHIKNNAMLVCPAIVNRDMTSKYSDPWVEGFVDYSMEGYPIRHISDYKYLQRGSRTEQKDAFIYRRSNMLYSKYKCKKFLNNNINFRCGVGYEYYPDVEGLPVSESGISITANQVIYPAVMYNGEETLVSGEKTPAGETVVIAKASTSEKAVVGRSDTVFIAGGTFLTDIGDISKFKPYELQLQNATGLRALHIGSDDENYENSSLSNIDTSKCKLLEELNVMGCTKLGDLDLSKNQLLKRVYAQKSNIKSVTLPNGGVLEELYLGDIVDLQILNQPNITTFDYDYEEYDSISLLHIENTPVVPVFEILEAKLPKLVNGIRLVGVNVTMEDASLFERLTGPEAQGKYLNGNGTLVDDKTRYPYISGKCHIKTLTGTQLQKINEIYPYIEITYDTLMATLIYMNEDGTEELGREVVINGEVKEQPTNIPAKESTAQYDFTYGGWSKTPNDEPDEDALVDIKVDTTVYVAYNKTVRTYKVEFYNGSELFTTDYVEYGAYAQNPGEPEKYGTTVPELYKFLGWAGIEDTLIVGETKFYAQFEFMADKIDSLSIADFKYTPNTDDNTMSIDKYVGDKTVGKVLSEYDGYEVISIDGFNDTDVKHIVLPDSIQIIQDEAFKNCASLEVVYVPESVIDIGVSAYVGCGKVAEVNYNALQCTNCTYSDKPFDQVGPFVLTIGSDVLKIPAYLFYDGKISSLIFDAGSQCEAIGAHAFENCDIESLMIPSSVVTIGDSAFAKNTHISSLEIPNGVKSIGARAFDRWSVMTELFIPKSVETIQNGAFASSPLLSKIMVDPENDNYYCIDNCLIGKINKKTTLIAGCKTSIIPQEDGITDIGNYAFQGCSGLQEVSIPDTVTNIGMLAFYGCSGLTSITLPDSISTIGGLAFAECANLTAINVPWAEGEVAGAPWGATNATIKYNYNK